jgi:hypothetical protein
MLGWGQSAAFLWKLHIAVPWRNWEQAEIDSLPREKLNSCSQACPACGRVWWLPIYQVLEGSLLRIHTRQPIPPRKSWAQTSCIYALQSCQIGRATPIVTKSSIPSSRRDSVMVKAPIKCVSTWIWNQGKESRAFIELILSIYNLYIFKFFFHFILFGQNGRGR